MKQTQPKRLIVKPIGEGSWQRRESSNWQTIFSERTKYLEGEVERVNHGACFKLICLGHGEKSAKEHRKSESEQGPRIAKFLLHLHLSFEGMVLGS